MGYKVNYNPDHPGTNCVEASRFAMALLMPKDLIEKWMKENKGSTDDEEYIKKMAEAFMVDISKMSVRLHSLGFMARYIKKEK